MEKLMLSSPQKTLILIAGMLGFLGVAAGAFGAHALKQRLTQEYLGTFEVAVRYQMYHALAMMVVAILMSFVVNPYMFYSGIAFLIGTLIFSGSLYILVLSGTRAWGAVTPIGGVILLFGWIFALIGIWKD